MSDIPALTDLLGENAETEVQCNLGGPSMSAPIKLAHIAVPYLLGLVFTAGCTHPVSTTNPSSSAVAASPRTAYAHVTVLDPKTNRWWNESQLYLKVESSLEPGTAVLLPINVGANYGLERTSHKTPFVMRPGRGETLHLEWLDDQTLTSEQRQQMLDTFEAGGYVVAVGGQLILLANGMPTGGLEVPKALGQIAKSSGKLLVGNADVKSFKTFGKADYHVPDQPPDSFRDVNPTLIVAGQNAKAEVRFYYPGSEKK